MANLFKKYAAQLPLILSLLSLTGCEGCADDLIRQRQISDMQQRGFQPDTPSDVYQDDSDPGEKRIEIASYEYYPGPDIYYNQEDKLYTFKDHGAWVQRHGLPEDEQKELNGDHETLHIRGDHPEHFDDRIRKDDFTRQEEHKQADDEARKTPLPGNSDSDQKPTAGRSPIHASQSSQTPLPGTDNPPNAGSMHSAPPQRSMPDFPPPGRGSMGR